MMMWHICKGYVMCVLKIAFSVLGIKHLTENQNVNDFKKIRTFLYYQQRSTISYSLTFRDDRYHTMELGLEPVSVSF